MKGKTQKTTMIAVLTILLIASAASAQNLNLSGSWEYSISSDIDYDEDQVILRGGKIMNGLNRSTNELKLRIYATKIPYSGGSITGWVLAEFDVANIPSKHSLTVTKKSRPVNPELKSGLYYFSLCLLEYRTNKFYVIDYYSFGQKSFNVE